MSYNNLNKKEPKLKLSQVNLMRIGKTIMMTIMILIREKEIIATKKT